ncbi:hypothetical protein AAEO56_05200 [Flavobacterium sp. DGU11]|uniref:Uncharacterized protein n=1 Tax=Flavobacterium arundinis TaxID=3139143 RepID=A0ABU9HU06_9FLAO
MGDNNQQSGDSAGGQSQEQQGSGSQNVPQRDTSIYHTRTEDQSGTITKRG